MELYKEKLWCRVLRLLWFILLVVLFIIGSQIHSVSLCRISFITFIISLIIRVFGNTILYYIMRHLISDFNDDSVTISIEDMVDCIKFFYNIPIIYEKFSDEYINIAGYYYERFDNAENCYDSSIHISDELEEFSNLYTFVFMHETVHMFASRYLKGWPYRDINNTIENELLTDTLAFLVLCFLNNNTASLVFLSEFIGYYKPVLRPVLCYKVIFKNRKNLAFWADEIERLFRAYLKVKEILAEDILEED